MASRTMFWILFSIILPAIINAQSKYEEQNIFEIISHEFGQIFTG